MGNYKLIDNIANEQYEFHIDDHVCKIEYSKRNGDEILFTHTEVPQAMEGRGIGSNLLEEALKDVDRQNLRLIPLCPFVSWYIECHPEWKPILEKRC